MPLMFSFCRIVSDSVRCDISAFILLADWGRVTQVTKRDGVRAGSSSGGVVVPLTDRAGVEEETEERMPESMAMPRVPTEY